DLHSLVDAQRFDRARHGAALLHDLGYLRSLEMPVSGFVVIRHPEAGVGTAPVEALEHWAARGWEAVSDERPDPSLFHLPHYAAPPEPNPPPLATAGSTTESAVAAVAAGDLTLPDAPAVTEESTE